MNLLYHAAAGAVISDSFLNEIDTKIVMAAVLPDLVGTIPSIVIRTVKVLKKPSKNTLKRLKKSLFHGTFAGDFDRIAYRTMHSLLTLPAIAFISYTFFNDIWILLSLAYLSHIVIDIPTHSGEWGTRIFYPLFDFHIDGKNWWLNLKTLLFMWILLAIIYVAYTFVI